MDNCYLHILLFAVSSVFHSSYWCINNGKYFATFVVNSLSSFKNSNAHDLYGFCTIYFGWKINDQDKNWNHIHCSTCAVDLRAWFIGKVHECHLPYLQPGKKKLNTISMAATSGYMWEQTLSKTQTCPQCWDRYYTLGSYFCPRYQRHGSLIMMCTHAHTTVCVCVYILLF